MKNPSQTDSALRSSSGVSGLDGVLSGGFIPGKLYLVDGAPGAGKTTLALQYLLEGVRQGERVLYVTLSETAEELRVGAQSHGWSLEGIDIVELVTSEDGGDVYGESEVTMYHPSEIELTETTRRVLDAVDRTKPKRMVLDSLSELRLLAQSSLRYRRQILALKQFFSGRDCTVLLLDDRTGDGADLQLQSIAHGVISLDHSPPVYGPLIRKLQVIKFRGSSFRSGYQDLSILPEGLVVFPRLTANEHGTSFARETVPSGIERLDQLLGGGIDRGTTTLLTGPPGTGKSTVSLQFAAAAAARGDHAAIFTFEESRHLLVDRAKGLGIPVREGTGPGEISIRQLDPGEVSPGQFAQLVRGAVETGGARVVVIDSLNGYLNSMPEEKALLIQLHELLSYLNNHGVATFLVSAQMGLMGPTMRGPVDASYLADSTLMFRMFEHQGRLKKAISVLKKRSGPHEEAIRQIWFDSQGVHLSEPLLHLRGILTGVPIETEKTDDPAQAPSSIDVN
jgi:circadian clock protein KaiC